jgi:hypothetical protein
MVLEVPPKALGAIDDQWFHWVTDFRAPGPDRGEGGRYLVLPPGYDGPVPEGGFYVSRSKTNLVLWFARSFLENKSDLKPVVELIKKATKIYPYEAGGLGPASPNSSPERPNSAVSPRRRRPYSRKPTASYINDCRHSSSDR